MGVVYLKMGRPQDAGTAFTKAVEINPNFEVTQANLGLYYLITQQREQAVDHLSLAATLDPSKLRTQVFLGEALCGMGRCTEAEQVLKRVISLDPAFSLAYRRLGYVYIELKRYGEALEMFRQFMNSPQGENAAEVKQLILQLEQGLK
jgi:superkiller protein 3